MKNLKVWQKLFLLGLVFLLPFAVVTYSLVSTVNRVEMEFAQLEIHGVDYIKPVRELLKEVQLHRAYGSAYLNGDLSFKSKFAEQQPKVEASLAAVDKADQTEGPPLAADSKEGQKVRSDWPNLRDACVVKLRAAQALQPVSKLAGARGGAQAADIQKSIDDHSVVINDLVAFIKSIGDASKLTLDPDLDSYYMMNIVVFTGPELIDLLGKTRTAGLIATTTRRLTDSQQQDMVRYHATTGYVLTQVEDSMDKAFLTNPSLRDRDPELMKARAENRANVQAFMLATTSLLEGRATNISAVEYEKIATTAIGSAYTLQDRISPSLRNLLIARQKRVSADVTQTMLWAVAGLLFVSLIGLMIVRDITKPLEQLMGAAKQISTGNLSVHLATDNRTDELGVLTATFNHMTGSLQKLAGAAGQIAGGDLTTRVVAQSEQDALGTAFAAMSENIHRMVGDLLTAVSVLGASASEIVASTSQLAAGATETATAISETTTTVEEIRQTAEVSNQKARHVAENAQKLAHISQTGKKAAEDNRQGMSRIRQQMGSIADSMGELSEQSQAIGAIIATVDDLTQQSNLLAVNAAIEAAKAGEQGKGFAVVAQEVKSLAEQSRQATTQVRSILSDIQKATSAAVMATEQGSKAVEAGVQQAGQAGESIVSLTDNVTEAAHAATQIAASSQQQLVGMEQMVLAMESIKQASTQNVDSARQLEASARDLGELGRQLQQLVEHYKL